MKKLIIIFLAIFILPVYAKAEQGTTAIEILQENGIIKGDGEGLSPTRYMTCGEFTAAALRLYEDDYEEVEHSMGDWKETVLLYRGSFSIGAEDFEKIFDKPIDPETAQKILLSFLNPQIQNGTHIGYSYWTGNGNTVILSFNGLSDLGYDMNVIPTAEFITREQGCRMLCELLYLEYPVVGDYKSCVYIAQYTLNGREIVCELSGDSILEYKFGNRSNKIIYK